MTTANVPTWQLTELDNLAAQGKLSGVDPSILAAIDQAESGGEVAGAGVNSSGYGGYFGLGAGTNYPGGHMVPASILETNSPASFDAQAETAGAEFASLLQANGGDVYAAERTYQGGSSEGIGIFSALGVPPTDTGATVTPGAATTADLQAQLAGAQLTAASSGPLLNRSMLTRIGIGAFSAVLALVAINALTRKTTSSPIDVLYTGGQATASQARTAHRKATTSHGPSRTPITRGTETKKSPAPEAAG